MDSQVSVGLSLGYFIFFTLDDRLNGFKAWATVLYPNSGLNFSTTLCIMCFVCYYVFCDPYDAIWSLLSHTFY